MSEENYEYETKCRRCGNMTVWHFCRKDQTDRLAWLKWIDHTVTNYTQKPCESCGMDTIQDVVSKEQNYDRN